MLRLTRRLAFGHTTNAPARSPLAFPVSGWIASATKLKERPDEVKRAIKASIKAIRYIRQNRSGTLPIMAQWLKIDQEMAARTYDATVKTFSDDLALPEAGLRNLIDDASEWQSRTAKFL